MRPYLRKLRIVWSVVWSVVVFLLVTCWIHSYFNHILIEGYVAPVRRYYVHSLAGCVVVDWQMRIFYEEVEWQEKYVPSYLRQRTTNAGIRIVRFGATVYAIAVSYWMLTLCAVCIAAVPWLSFKRFSLRSLLIATTLVAVALGLIVWLL
jgi:hypothetical protein